MRNVQIFASVNSSCCTVRPKPATADTDKLQLSGAELLLAAIGTDTRTDTVEPQQAYPASKVAAEKLLRESRLNWSILRFPFVYGDGDGHLEALPKHLVASGFHPANRMTTIHHRDIAAAMGMALDGLFDCRTVTISDEAPTTIYELVELVGEKMDPSAEALPNPWHLHVDASLARSLGFRPTVRTVYQTALEGRL